MRTQVILADSAQADSQGKAHALGMGWNVTSSPTPPMAIVLMIEVEWNEANTPYTVAIELVDEDGNPVLSQGGPEEVPLQFEGDFEVGRPPGSKAGVPLGVSMVISVGPGIDLRPGGSYRWRVFNSGQPGIDLGAQFHVRDV